MHNTETGESLWKFPEDVMKAVVEWDVQRMKDKERKAKGENEEDVAEATTSGAKKDDQSEAQDTQGTGEVDDNELASDEEYEEIEVTDDEEGDEDDGPSKRQKTDEPMDFNEDDIAYQLEAMGEEYDMDETGFDEEDGDEVQLSEEDSKALFYDLLDDHNINPYRTWDQIIDDGHIIDDDRYTALPNMRSRKDTFSEWSRNKIQMLKEQREREEKKDPRIPYIAFMQKHASPKLYWPEFKRKYRKETEMRDSKVSDKDREKWYREHVKRLQLPESTLKSDISALLKHQPLSMLNRSTLVDALPPSILTDLRFISLAPAMRDPLIEAYITTLPPAPEIQGEEEEAEALAKRRDRERREKALADREARVQDEKRKQRRELEFGKDRLRAEERELERAMRVNKDGLRGQLASPEDESNGVEDE